MNVSSRCLTLIIFKKIIKSEGEDMLKMAQGINSPRKQLQEKIKVRNGIHDSERYRASGRVF